MKQTSVILGKRVFFQMLNIPHFYGEVISAYKKCKKVKHISNLKRDEFLTEIIWRNNLFQYDYKPIYFENWILSSILYIKDVLDDHHDCIILNIFTIYWKRKTTYYINIL